MIKINGKKGDTEIIGNENEVIAELSIAIYYFSEAFAKKKGIPSNVAAAYILNQINANLQRKFATTKSTQGGEQQ